MFNASADAVRLYESAVRNQAINFKLASTDWGGENRAQFFYRLNNLTRLLEKCIAKDNRTSDFSEARKIAIAELGFTPETLPDEYSWAVTLDDINGMYDWPPPIIDLEYRTAVALVGLQHQVGAYSVLWQDLLSAYEDNAYLLIDVYSDIADHHPQCVLGRRFSENDLDRYSGFFRNAATTFQKREAELTAQLPNAGGKGEIIKQAIRLAVEIYGYVQIVVEAMEIYYEKKREEARKAEEARQAEEAAKKKAEEEARKAEEEKLRAKAELGAAIDKAMREAKPPRDTRWLDRLESWERGERIA